MSAARGGVVAVYAHPDDETLTSGALLATAVAAGLPATVITCTRGEQGEVIGPRHRELEGDGPALGRFREGEVARAMAALGGVDQVFLDHLPGAPVRYADSGMAWVDGHRRAGVVADLPADALVAADLERAAARLADWLRNRRPELVVSDEPGGSYGHPDHVTAHQIVRRAVELLGGQAPAWAWAVQTEWELRAGYRALGADTAVARLISGHIPVEQAIAERSALSLPAPDGPLPAMARRNLGTGFTVRLLPIRDRVLAALRAHGTQIQAVTAVEHPDVVGCYALSHGVLAPMLPVERYQWADQARIAVIDPALGFTT